MAIQWDNDPNWAGYVFNGGIEQGQSLRDVIQEKWPQDMPQNGIAYLVDRATKCMLRVQGVIGNEPIVSADQFRLVRSEDQVFPLGLALAYDKAKCIPFQGMVSKSHNRGDFGIRMLALEAAYGSLPTDREDQLIELGGNLLSLLQIRLLKVSTTVSHVNLAANLAKYIDQVYVDQKSDVWKIKMSQPSTVGNEWWRPNRVKKLVRSWIRRVRYVFYGKEKRKFSREFVGVLKLYLGGSISAAHGPREAMPPPATWEVFGSTYSDLFNGISRP